MKRLIVVLLLVAGMTATPALAGTIGPYTVARVGGYFSGNGGEFTYNAALNNDAYVSGKTADISTLGTFQTFCLETSETAYSPGYFNLSYAAKFGGTSSADPISKGTAWLYSQFVAGSLGGYNYTVGVNRSTQAYELQKAIWYLEGEADGVANSYYNLAVAALGTAVTDDANGYLDVYVLNNYRDEAGLVRQQDFLWKSVPDGGATLMLLGGALMGLGVLRRKFRQ